MTKEFNTLLDMARWAASRFNATDLCFAQGRETAIDEAIDLILHVTNMTHDLPDIFWQARLTEIEKDRIITLAEKRINQRIPMPYLTNNARFLGLDFYVDERVLIPRSPIYELIEDDFQPWINYQPKSVLDLCCGSGCIGIACKIAMPFAEVVIADISKDALEVAAINLSKHRLENQINIVQSDGVEDINQRFDLIICNPPYVDDESMHALPLELQYEPKLALTAGTDGLDFVRPLMNKIDRVLNDNGALILEVGEAGQALLDNFPNIPFVEISLKNSDAVGVFIVYKNELPNLQQQTSSRPQNIKRVK